MVVEMKEDKNPKCRHQKLPPAVVKVS